MKKHYNKPTLKVTKLDTTISMCMSSGHHGHGHGHGHGHTNDAHDAAFGGSHPTNVSGFGEKTTPW